MASADPLGDVGHELHPRVGSALKQKKLAFHTPYQIVIGHGCLLSGMLCALARAGVPVLPRASLQRRGSREL